MAFRFNVIYLWTMFDAITPRIPDLSLGGARRCLGDELVVNGVLHEGARRGAAVLPVIRHDTVVRPLHSFFHWKEMRSNCI